MQDFTLATYKRLLQKLLTNGYSFQTLQDFIQHSEDKTVILRHDVDRLPGNALVFAKIEKQAGIKASYYFRIVKESYDENIIKQIAKMGHEIGYHYEDMDLSSRVQKSEVRSQKSEVRGQKTEDGGHKELGDSAVFDKAIKSFERNLEKLRKLYPVKTICMHGSPLSKWDNRDLWERYDYRDFGIIAEPYFDLDFDEVLYLTDTGRSWNNSKMSVRDKIIKKKDKNAGIKKVSRKDAKAQRTEEKNVRLKELETKKRGRSFDSLRFRSTWDIIEAAEKGLLPDKIMLTTHPQRWDDRFGPWMKELVWQNFKNVVKKWMVSRKDAPVRSSRPTG